MLQDIFFDSMSDVTSNKLQIVVEGKCETLCKKERAGIPHFNDSEQIVSDLLYHA